jgi:mRNA-degrading endonuclease RelE of RelBE toxin-antitoxin system
MIIEVSLRFEKELKQLSKKYKKIKDDLRLFKKEILNNPTLGTSLGNDCYKVRVPNSSIPTGKSGGFRIITLVKIQNDKIVLLTIYSKTEKENISNDELKSMLECLNED